MNMNTPLETKTTISNIFKKGYLEIITGPMFSGKTSKLIEIYKQCVFCEIPVVVINHSSDTRYHDELLSSHDGSMIPCIQTDNLTNIWNTDSTEKCEFNNNQLACYNADIILINEAQFFDNLYTTVVSMLKSNKRIYISGLDGDFKRERFGEILDLIPMCDSFIKLKSLCGICKNGTKAIFSLRLTSEKTQMVIGSTNYVPVCRECYEKHNK